MVRGILLVTQMNGYFSLAWFSSRRSRNEFYHHYPYYFDRKSKLNLTINKSIYDCLCDKDGKPSKGCDDLCQNTIKNCQNFNSTQRSSYKRVSHWLFFWTNTKVRTLSQFHFKAFLIDGRNPMEKKFWKSNEPFLSYKPTSTGHSAKVGWMAGISKRAC